MPAAKPEEFRRRAVELARLGHALTPTSSGCTRQGVARILGDASCAAAVTCPVHQV